MPVRSTGLFFVAAILAAAPLSNASRADDRPRWDVGEICASSALGAQCPKIESENRRSVLNRWEAIPVADRTACAAVVTETGKPSYKALLSCLEESQLKALEGGSARRSDG
ncbi:MAG: hypothetical protein ABL893_15610 [Hyphomicrobium sp.]